MNYLRMVFFFGFGLSCIVCNANFEYECEILQRLEYLENKRKTSDAEIENLGDRLKTYEAENEDLNNKLKTSEAEIENLGNKLRASNDMIDDLKAAVDQFEAGPVFVRWGKNTCPGNGTDFMYKGYIGGTKYTSHGGGSNPLCLPENPTWNKYRDGNQIFTSEIYGTEIEDPSGFSTLAFGYDYNNQDPPCSVCQSGRPSVTMIPGRSSCLPGWTMEYTGYLVGGLADRPSSEFICLDSRPDELPHGLDAGSDNQHILFFTAAHCGSLPCPPYHEGREIACVVCSK